MEKMTYSTGDLAKRLRETKTSVARHVKRLEQYCGPVKRNEQGAFRLTEQEVARVEATSKMMREGKVRSYAEAYDVLLSEKVRAETVVKPEPDTLPKTIHIDPLNGNVMNPDIAPAVPDGGSNGEGKTVGNEPDNGSKKSTEKGAWPLLNDLTQRLKNW